MFVDVVVGSGEMEGVSAGVLIGEWPTIFCRHVMRLSRQGHMF